MVSTLALINFVMPALKVGLVSKNSAHDEIDGRYVYAVHNIEYAWYLLETFNRTDAAEQLEIKTEVDRIEREYKRILDEWGE